MCVLILKPAGVEIDRETLQKCWNKNSDGAGFAYVHRKQLHVSKGHMKFEELMNGLEKVGIKKKMLLHFRISTSGGTMPSLTHPFWINEELAVGHNGILSMLSNQTSHGISDTAILAKGLAENFPNLSSEIENKDLRNLLEEKIGSGNKLCFLRNDEEHFIINEAAGDWLDMPGGKAWFSNTWWKNTNNYSFSFPDDLKGKRKNKFAKMRFAFDDDDEEEYSNNNSITVYSTDPATGKIIKVKQK